MNTQLSNLQTRAKQLRKNMTDAEQRLWFHLRNKQLNGIKFRRQQIIGYYIVDFVSIEYRLIIELDGSQHLKQSSYDEKRSQFLHSKGYRVLRFWNHEVLQNTTAVLNHILFNCKEA